MSNCRERSSIKNRRTWYDVFAKMKKEKLTVLVLVLIVLALALYSGLAIYFGIQTYAQSNKLACQGTEYQAYLHLIGNQTITETVSTTTAYYTTSNVSRTTGYSFTHSYDTQYNFLGSNWEIDTCTYIG